MELVCVRNTKRLYDLISTNERWLMRRVVDYAKKHGYIKYTSTREKDWEASIRGLSESILKALEHHLDLGLNIAIMAAYHNSVIKLYKMRINASSIKPLC